MFEMREFTHALEVIAEVMRQGARTHPDNDWIARPFEYHIARAEDHLRLLAKATNSRTISLTRPPDC